MQAFLTDVGTVVTYSIQWMSRYINIIMDTPALFTICVAVPLCTMAVNLLNRLIRL